MALNSVSLSLLNGMSSKITKRVNAQYSTKKNDDDNENNDEDSDSSSTEEDEEKNGNNDSSGRNKLQYGGTLEDSVITGDEEQGQGLGQESGKGPGQGQGLGLGSGKGPGLGLGLGPRPTSGRSRNGNGTAVGGNGDGVSKGLPRILSEGVLAIAADLTLQRLVHIPYRHTLLTHPSYTRPITTPTLMMHLRSLLTSPSNG